MSSQFESSLQDRVGVWLDENMASLGHNERLFSPHQNVMTQAEAMRPRFFERICEALTRKNGIALRRKAMKFPPSLISRVNNAISHLSRYTPDELRTRNVIFLPQTLMQLAHQLPVAKALAEADRSCGFVFRSPNWATGLKLDGVDVIEHTRALQSQILCARLKARVMWLRLSREEKLVVDPFVFQDREYDLGPVLLDAVLDSINAIFEGHALGKYLLEHTRPKLMAVADELTPGTRILVALAKQNGVRCVDLAGSVKESPMDSYRQCDRFVVFGNYGKRALAGSGIDTKKIKACGAPYLDELAFKRPLPFLSKSENESAKSHFVLVDVADRWAPVFWRQSQVKNENFVLFLTHRVGPIIQSHLKTSRNFKLCQRNELSNRNLASCLKTADMVVTDKIAVALEALSIGKKVVAFNVQNAFDDPEFLSSQLATVVNHEDELLRPFVLTANDDAIARQMFEDYFFRRDGNSAQRVASVIAEECQK